jgi:C1A family cysteine protease
MRYAFEYARTNPLELENDYPYEARDQSTGTSCRYNRSKGVGQVKNWVAVSRGHAALKAAINVGPVSVAVDAGNLSYQLYETGVVTSGCGTALSHGNVAVGYGTMNGQGYYMVKNSWGSGWGDKGYIRISDQGNVCGITMQNSYPTE